MAQIADHVQPDRFSWIAQCAREHACRRNGGHWWHPILGSLIDWFCCSCGSTRDGMPEDGPGQHPDGTSTEVAP